MAMESFQSIFQLNGKNGIRRSVTMDDSSLIYLWRSEPDTYIYTKSRSVSSQEVHKAWTQDRLESLSKEPYFAYEISEHLSAVTRLEISDSDNYEISILVAPNWRGLGLASFCISDSVNFGFKNLGAKAILANVHNKNLASINLFKKCGFKLTGLNNTTFLKFKIEY